MPETRDRERAHGSARPARRGRDRARPRRRHLRAHRGSAAGLGLAGRGGIHLVGWRGSWPSSCWSAAGRAPWCRSICSVAPVQLRQRGDVRGLRGPRRRALPAPDPVAADRRVHAARGGRRAGADDDRDAAAVGPRRTPRPANRSAAADEPRPDRGGRRPRAALPGRRVEHLCGDGVAGCRGLRAGTVADGRPAHIDSAERRR